jgi:hypothetical protein
MSALQNFLASDLAGILAEQLNPRQQRDWQEVQERGNAFIDSRQSYRKKYKRPDALLIDRHAEPFADDFRWISNQMYSWRKSEREKSADPFALLRGEFLRQVAGIPFSTYSVDDDLFMARLREYQKELEAYRKKSKQEWARVIPNAHTKAGRWLAASLGDWRKVENRQMEATPSRLWRIEKLKSELQLPVSSYSADYDLFLENAGKFLTHRMQYRAATGNWRALLIPDRYGDLTGNRSMSASARWIQHFVAWWRDLPEAERDLPANRWYIEGVRGLGIPYAGFSQFDDNFRIKALKYLVDRAIYREEINDPYALAIPRDHPTLYLSGRWLGGFQNEYVAMDAARRQSASSQFRAQIVSSELELPYIGYNPADDAFMAKVRRFVQDRNEHRKGMYLGESRLIPNAGSAYPATAVWLGEILPKYHAWKAGAAATEQEQWRLRVLDPVFDFPFPGYNRKDDEYLEMVNRYEAARVAYRKATGKPEALIVQSSPGPEFPSDAIWIKNQLAWWKSLNAEEALEPRNQWRIQLLNKRLQIPNPDYVEAREETFLNKQFSKRVDEYVEKRRVYREKSQDEISLVLPATPEYEADQAWLRGALERWRNATPEQRAQEDFKWRIELLQKKVGIPFPEYTRDDDLFLLQLEQYRTAREKYRKKENAPDANFIPYNAWGYSKKWNPFNDRIAEIFAAIGTPRDNASFQFRRQAVVRRLELPHAEFDFGDEEFIRNARRYVQARNQFWGENKANLKHTLLPPGSANGYKPMVEWLKRQMEWWGNLDDAGRLSPRAAWRIRVMQEEIGLLSQYGTMSMSIIYGIQRQNGFVSAPTKSLPKTEEAEEIRFPVSAKAHVRIR